MQDIKFIGNVIECQSVPTIVVYSTGLVLSIFVHLYSAVIVLDKIWNLQVIKHCCTLILVNMWEFHKHNIRTASSVLYDRGQFWETYI